MTHIDEDDAKVVIRALEIAEAALTEEMVIYRNESYNCVDPRAARALQQKANDLSEEIIRFLAIADNLSQ